MKKTLIALAVAGFSFNAAAVNFSAGNAEAVAATAQKYASEIKLVDGVRNLKAVNITKAITSTTDLSGGTNGAFTNSSKVFARVAISGAEFKDSNLIVGNTITTNWDVVNVTDNVLVVEHTLDASSVVQSDLTFNFEVQVADKAGAQVEVKFYKSAQDAVLGQAGFEVSSLTKSSTLFSFAQGFDISAQYDFVDDKNAINVQKDSKEFLNAAGEADIMTLVSAKKAANVLNINGVAIQDTDVIGQWTVEGPFLEGSIVDGTTKLTAEAAAKPINVAKGLVTYELPANNDVAIPTGEVKATFTPDSALTAVYDVAEQSFTTQLTKNGTFDDAELVFNKNTGYLTFLRVSNTGAQAGNINFTVYADDGSFKTFPLSAVAGQESDELAGNASTTQIDLKNLAEAAEAAGLQFSGDGKMRIKAEGDVSGISLQTYVLGKDGQNIVQFN